MENGSPINWALDLKTIEGPSMFGF